MVDVIVVEVVNDDDIVVVGVIAVNDDVEVDEDDEDDVRDVVRDAVKAQKYPPRQKHPEKLSREDVQLTIFV